MGLDNPNTFLTLTEPAPAFTPSSDMRSRIIDSVGNHIINTGNQSSVQIQASSGENTVTIDANANDFSIVRSGAEVTLTNNGGREISIGASTTPQTLVFANGAADLRIVNTDEGASVQLGGQSIPTSATQLDPPTVGFDTSVTIADAMTADSGVTQPVRTVGDVHGTPDSPLDATGGNKTFNILPSASDVTIDGFAAGDVLNVVPDASLEVLTDADENDGARVLRVANPNTDARINVQLTGLAQSTAGSLVDSSSFTEVFGTNAFERTAGTAEDPNMFAILAGDATRFDVPTNGRAQIVDTAGAQTINVDGGASANVTGGSGENTIQIDAFSENFTVSRSGAEVRLAGAGSTDIRVGAREETQSVVFADGAADLRIEDDGSGATVRLGNLEVTQDETDLASANVGLDSQQTAADAFGDPAATSGNVTISDSNTGPFDAGGADVTFEIESGAYVTVIENFGEDDQIVQPARFSRVPDANQTDGVETFKSQTESGTATVRLTGLSDDQDQKLFNVPQFNDVFGDDTLI